MDDEGNHTNRTVVHLIPNELYLDYCLGGREQDKAVMEETRNCLDFNPAMIWFIISSKTLADEEMQD
eukprot:749977-Hanusia_phi.AAC.7